MKLLLLSLVALFTLPSLASETKTFDCKGVVKTGMKLQESAFIAQHWDYSQEEGYKYEKIIITKPDTNEIDLKELRQAAKLSKDCVLLEEFTPRMNGKFTYYKFYFKQTCEEDTSLHTAIEAFCTRVD